MLTLTRVSPTVFTFTAQDGDLSARLHQSERAEFGDVAVWTWNVDVCGESIDHGRSSYRNARASLMATLEAVASAFVA